MNALADHLYIFAMFIPLIALHEAAHAWVARLLGDDTAEMEGRLTLNPASHVDLVGTIVWPAISLFLFNNPAPIAWGRPVPVTGSNFENPRRDEIIVALAGPAANLLVGLAAIALGAWLIPADSPWQKLAAVFALVSVCLGLFHLLPIPGLDGWPIARNLFGFPTDWIERNGNIWISILVMLFILTPCLALLRMLAESLLNAFSLLLGGQPLAPLLF